MALIDLLTIVACLVVGAFIVRLGNRALRKQRIAKKRRWLREKEMAEEAEGQAIDVALHDLALWREQGHLKASKASWEELVGFARKHPEAVLELQTIVKHNMERTEGRGEIRIALSDEDTEEFVGNAENEHEREPKDTLIVQTPLLTR